MPQPLTKKQLDEWSQRNGEAFNGLMDVNGLLPVSGDIQSGLLAANDLSKGNYGSAALNGVGLLPFVPSLAGMFIGKGAKVWDVLKSDEAQKLAKAGVDPKEIWKKTGTMQGVDGAWRQEIPDNAARIQPDVQSALAFAPMGITKAVKPTKYELSHEAARKNAVDMLGLPENNTAMDRAKSLGFDINQPLYHGTKQDVVGGFNPVYDDNLTFTTPEAKFASSWIGKGARQKRTGDLAESERNQAYQEYKDIRSRIMNLDELNKLKGDDFNNEYDRLSALARAELARNGLSQGEDGIHGNVLPLLSRVEKTYIPSKKPEVMTDYIKSAFPDEYKDQGLINMFNNGDYLAYETPKAVEHLKNLGYDSMMLRESSFNPASTLAVFNPSAIRSRFAAFDPARVNENDILGQIDPSILPYLVGGGLLGAAGVNYGSKK